MKLGQYQCPVCDTVATFEDFDLVHRACQGRGFFIECTHCETEQNVLALEDVTDEHGHRYVGDDIDEVEAGLADRLTK